MAIRALKCPSCGADITLDDSREYGFCAYCGSQIQLGEQVHVHVTHEYKGDTPDINVTNQYFYMDQDNDSKPNNRGNIMNTDYSQNLDDELWNAVGEDYEQEYEYDELIQKINSPDFFRSFSKRITSFYNEHFSVSLAPEEAAKDFIKHAKGNSVSLNRNTIMGWFTGSNEPKKGVGDRKRMFFAAFAMGLTVKETELFFHKVFLDKAFNRRNPEEFIFLYCINAHKTFDTAQALIEKLGEMSSSSEKDITIFSEMMGDYAAENKTEKEVLEFIASHPYNFEMNDTKAKQFILNLRSEIQGTKEKEGIASQEYEFTRITHGLDEDNGSLGKDRTSTDFMLYIIKQHDALSDKEYVTKVREIFPREVIQQFPDKQSFAEENASSYTLRKELILLYFYHYWTKNLLSVQKYGDYDSFVDEMNDILNDCGYSPLYIGNPYDWLFLYCSAAGSQESDQNPVDIFRFIINPEI